MKTFQSLLFVLFIFLTNTTQAQVFSVPYFDNFDSLNNWTTSGSNPGWQLGMPNGQIINTTHSGNNAWVTNLSGTYPNSSNTHLYSPLFNIPTGATTYVQFWHYADMIAGEDYGHIQFSANGGTTWAGIGYIGFPNSTNWYNANVGGVHCFSDINTGWQFTSAPLDPVVFGGQTVQFRFSFVSNAINVADGWAIDDFGLSFIANPYDLGIIDEELICVSNSALNPVFDTLIAPNQYSMSISIVNYGIYPLDSIPIALMGNNNLIVTETYYPIIPAGDTAYYTFNYIITAPIGPGNLCANVQHLLDMNTTNNEICRYYIGILSGVNIEDTYKSKFRIFPISPNPVNESGEISFEIPKPNNVSFEIRNIIGEKVYSEIIFGKQGKNTIHFGTNDFPSGIYLCVLEYEGLRLSKKLVIAK